MTREEAIEIIRREYSCVDRDCDIERSCGKCPYSMPSKEPILKAYCLAVEALEQLTSYEQTINKLTKAISEQEPKIGRCKDCKWWKDSDGAYRRGIGAESQCPINRKEVFEGNGYCFLFEPQESEDEE